MDYQAIRQRFGGKLRELRLAKGVTQEQLAESVGKTIEHISFLERGERSPSFELLLDIARALDTSASVLMSSDNSESSGNIAESLAVVPPASPLPEPAQQTEPAKEQRQSDLERLNAAFTGIQQMQELAHEYGK